MRHAIVMALPLLAALAMGPAAEAARPAPVVAGRYAPKDECSPLPGAAAFRASLTAAVRARDAEAMGRLSAPEITLDFGGGAGRDEFVRRLRGEEGAQLWQELDEILALGCAVQTALLFMPWFYAQDIGDFDPFDVMLVTGTAVPLRTAPNARARPVRLLSWVLVEPISADDHEAPFRRVRLPGNRVTGYVASARLRSPADYRLIAERAGPGWRIATFIAGD